MFMFKKSVNKNEKVAFWPYQGVYQCFGCISFSHLKIRGGKWKNKGKKKVKKEEITSNVDRRQWNINNLRCLEEIIPISKFFNNKETIGEGMEIN